MAFGVADMSSVDRRRKSQTCQGMFGELKKSFLHEFRGATPGFIVLNVSLREWY
jgi:hypothetical protein